MTANAGRARLERMEGEQRRQRREAGEGGAGVGEGKMQEQKAENAVTRPWVRVRGRATGRGMCLGENLFRVFLLQNRNKKILFSTGFLCLCSLHFRAEDCGFRISGSAS